MRQVGGGCGKVAGKLHPSRNIIQLNSAPEHATEIIQKPADTTRMNRKFLNQTSNYGRFG